jgi:hypothetical protein
MSITQGDVVTFTTATTIVVETCYTCGVVFGLGAEFRQARINDKKEWYCPNGHGQHYIGKSEAERLRQQLDWANSRAASWKDQAETAEARRRGEKAAKTRLKNRIAKGVCPCCNRSFVDLGRHMAGQHPHFVEAAAE